MEVLEEQNRKVTDRKLVRNRWKKSNHINNYSKF